MFKETASIKDKDCPGGDNDKIIAAQVLAWCGRWQPGNGRRQ